MSISGGTVPTYVYRCEQCDSLIERRQRFQDPPLTECQECAGTLRRVLQPVGIIFKGSGFYSTDYKSGRASGSAEEKAETAAATATASDSSPSTETASSGDAKPSDASPTPAANSD